MPSGRAAEGVRVPAAALARTAALPCIACALDGVAARATTRAAATGTVVTARNAVSRGRRRTRISTRKSCSFESPGKPSVTIGGRGGEHGTRVGDSSCDPGVRPAPTGLAQPWRALRRVVEGGRTEMSIGYSIDYSEACTVTGPLTGAGTRPLLGHRRLFTSRPTATPALNTPSALAIRRLQWMWAPGCTERTFLLVRVRPCPWPPGPRRCCGRRPSLRPAPWRAGPRRCR